MKLTAFGSLFGHLKLDMLNKFAGWGWQAVEVATGGEVPVQPWWTD
jgi:hypothetical protein